MKRSSMENMICGLLSAMYETNEHPMKQLKNAQNILSALEEWGMRPPYDASQDDGQDTFEWESE